MRLWIALLLLSLTIIYGCSNKDIYILSEDEYLLLPIKVSEFSGFNDKVNLKVQTEYANDEKFLRLLNISRFNAIIVDNYTFNFLKVHDPSWIKVCTVAVKKPAIFLLKKAYSDGKLYIINLPVYKELMKQKGLSYISTESSSSLFNKDFIAYTKPIRGFKIVGSFGSMEFYLCVKSDLLTNHSKAVSNLVKSWEEGVTYLKDEDVFEYLLDRTRIKRDATIKFRSCY